MNKIYSSFLNRQDLSGKLVEYTSSPTVRRTWDTKLMGFVLLFMLSLFGSYQGFAQINVTSSSGSATVASYTSLEAAITAINDGSIHSGTVLCAVAAGYTETAPAGGFVITATGSAGNTITFAKSGAGANPLFTASGTLTAGSLTDAVFKIMGGDYITIDGFTMVENASNTTTAAATNNMTEFGVALFYATTTDGCQNVTIKNCTISLLRTYQNSFGIYANSTHSSTLITTTASATTATGGNSNLAITGNTISDVNQGISVVGPTATVDHNEGLTILGNIITNYGATGTFSGYANVSGTINGILARNVKNYSISNNSITSSGLNTAGTLRGIFVPSFNNAPTGTFSNAIDTNTLDIKSGLLSGSVSGIVSESGTASSTAAISITGNTFNGLAHTTATASGTLIFIQQVGPYGSATVSNNNFNSLTANTTGSVTFISASYSMPTATSTQTYTNNAITGGFNKTGAGGTVTGYTSSASSVAGSVSTATGNNFSGITVTGATSLTGWTTSDGGAPTKTVSGNTFTNWTGGTSTVTGISFNYGSTDGGVFNNMINNITSGGTIVGINFGSSNSGTSQTVTGNTITNLTSTGTGTGFNINGISIGANSVANLMVHNNTIHSFANASSTGQVIGIIAAAGALGKANIYNHDIYNLNASGVTPLMSGIAIIGTAGILNVHANKVRNLLASGATTSNGAVNGISVQGGITVNVYNNVIGELANPLGNAINAIMGISVQSTVANSFYNAYNNTVFLNASSSGANFGTTGFFHSANATASTAVVEMTNNIIINRSTANGTGLTTAFRRTLAGYANFSTASNRNLLYAGTPSATNVIFSDGTTNFETIAAYKTSAAPRESVSFTKEGTFTFSTPGSFFVSLTGSSVDFLRPVAGITSQIESGGLSFPALFTTDFTGAKRAGNAGYVGTGTSPDLGAYEFSGSTPAPIVTVNAVTPAAATQCTAAARVVSVNVNPSSGTTTSVMLNYSFNGAVQPAITMTNTAGTIWQGTLPAATPVNASVTWNVSATNSIGLTSVFNGTSYADEPLFGLIGAAMASDMVICPGESTVLTGNLSGATPAVYAAPPTVSNPTTDEDLGNVTISQGATVILNNTTPRNSLVGTIGTATGVAGSYSNFTAFGPFNLTAGQTYNYSVASLQDATGYGNSMAIYIDYNRNGVFTDDGEKVHSVGSTTTGAHTETGSFQVPAGAFNGLTRMRVINNEGLITSPTQAVSYGEYEEYSVYINSTATGGGQVPTYTVSWSDGVNTVGTGILSVSPTTTTTYTATITNSGCSVSPAPTVTITVNPAPIAPVATASSQCGAKVPTASVSDPNAFTAPIFTWYADNVTTTALQTGLVATYQTSISETTTFYVSVKNPTTLCESTRTPVTITVSAPQAITLSTAGTLSSCLGSATTVVASSTNASYTYSWTASPAAGSGISGTETGASQNIMPTALGTYTYTVTGTDGVCTATIDVTITVNVVPTPVVVDAVSGCINTVSTLTATGGTIANFPIIVENFNGATNNWTTINNSTGGNPALGAWVLTANGTNGFNSNDASQFYISDSDAQGGGGTTLSYLESPSFSTLNYTEVNLGFYHYFRNFSTSTAKAQYSVDGVNWIDLATYTGTTVGTSISFAAATIALPAAALNQSNVKVRFFYSASYGYYWAIDNVTISGTQSTGVVWSPTTNLYTDAAATLPYTGTNATTVYVKSATAGVTTYTATATSGTGCTIATSTTVTINATSAPTAVAQTFCNGATVANLVATGATGASFKWYAASTGGAALVSTEALASGTYYVSQTVAGCESPRTSVAVTVNVTAVPAALAQTFCDGATVANLVATGTVGSTFQWYAAVTGGTALTSATALATGNYFVSQTVDGCESTRTTVPVTVNVTAAATADAQTFCNSATVADLATTSGTNIQWYAGMTGGSALTSTTALATGTYYVSQTLLGCESARTAVVVTVNVTAAPTAAAQTFCGSATVANLVATTGANLQWYAGMTGGSALASTTALASGTYYVSQTLAGCESERTAVSVTVNVTAAPTAAAQSFCNSATVANLVATTGANLQWYAGMTGGSALTSTTALATGTYYVSQTLVGCESARTAVSVTVNVIAAPTGTAIQDFTTGQTLANFTVATAAGGTVTWYSSATGSTVLPSTTVLVSGTTYYASQTVGGCESTARLAVTAGTDLKTPAFELSSLRYYPNPVQDILTVDYSDTIQGVQLYNMLGQLVYNRNTNASKVTIDMASMATGNYILQVTVKGITKNVKVIKK